MNKLFATLFLTLFSVSLSFAQLNLIGTVQTGQIPGLAASATIDTTNAANITSGTLPFARLATGTNGSSVAIGNDSRFLNATSLNGTSISSLSGLLKLSTGTPSVASATDVIGLFSGCSGTQVLQANGTCGTGGTIYTGGNGINVSGSTISTTTGVPVWQKVTITSTSVNAAATNQAVNLITLSARQKICGLSEKNTIAFAGTSITGVTVTVGDSAGTSTTYTNIPFSVSNAVSNTNFQDVAVFGSASYAGGSVQANFTSTGANLSNLTGGSVDFDLCVVTMP